MKIIGIILIAPILLAAILGIGYLLIKYPLELGIAVIINAICLAFVIGVNILRGEQ